MKERVNYIDYLRAIGIVVCIDGVRSYPVK